MSANQVAEKVERWLVVSGMVCVLTGCQTSADKGSRPTAAVAATQVTGAPTTADVPLDRIDEPNFLITWTPRQGSVENEGAAGELVLTAKSPFKPNQEYPHKFKLRGTNVVLAKTELTKADMQVSGDRVVVPVAFDVSGPNPALQGTLAFSVCTAESCLIERKDIRLTVTKSEAVLAPAVGVDPTGTSTTK